MGIGRLVTSFTVGILLCLFVLISFTPEASAVTTVPTKMNFQGRVANSSGTILANGTYNMRFKIFSASTGGAALWSSERLVSASQGVQVTNGQFSVQIGDITPLPSSIFASGALYFEVELPTPATATSSSPSWTEGAMTPRNQLATSAYSFNSETLDGLDSSEFAQIGSSNTFTGTNKFKNTTNSTSSFAIQDSSGANLLVSDTSNSRIYIGNPTADANTTFLGVDSYNGGASDPSGGFNGSIYYNTSLNKLRCYEAGVWKDCISSAAASGPAPCSYRAFRFQPTALRNDTQLSMSEFEVLVDGNRQSGTPYAVGSTTFGGEEFDKAYDNDVNTKWFNGNGTSGYLYVVLPAQVAANGYRIATADNLENRDPISWNIYGSNDTTGSTPGTWTRIDAKTNFATPTARKTYIPEQLLDCGSTSTASSTNTVKVSSDVTSSMVANTLSDVTGLSFDVTAGDTYSFKSLIEYTSPIATTGSRWVVDGPASSYTSIRSQYTLAATTLTMNSVNGYNLPAASNASSVLSGNIATVEGRIRATASGTVKIRFASEVIASPIVAKAGSTLTYTKE
jgi:hypothetical protein